MTTTAHFSRIIRDQIGTGALMRIGARDFTYSEIERFLQFAITGKRGHRTLVRVTLEPNDTYTVAIGRLHKRSFEFGWLEQVELVHAEQLSAAVQRLCGEL